MTITVTGRREVTLNSASLDRSSPLSSAASVYVFCCGSLLAWLSSLSLILSVVVIVPDIIVFVSCRRSREADCKDNSKETGEKVVLSHLGIGLFIQIDIYKVTRRHFHM